MRKFRRLPEDERPAPAKGSKLAEALQVPAGAVSVLPRMEFCGNREVTIDGSKGVLEYDENLIRINTVSYTHLKTLHDQSHDEPSPA